MSYNPLTQVLLTIEKPLQDSIVTDSGIKFYIDPTYKKEWQSAVTARIAALPLNPVPNSNRVLSQLNVGDEVAISYNVVADFDFSSDRDRFMPATEDNPYIKEFYNGKGEAIRVYALPTRKGIAKAVWCAVYLTKKQELIDGVQGDEGTVERWLSQFPFGKTDEYTFNNFFQYANKDYWQCRPDQIFAKRVKGHIISVSNRVICSPIDESIKDDSFIDTIGIKDRVKIRYQDRAKVLSGGKSKGLKKDNIIGFSPNHIERYTLWDKDYYLINESFVLGKWN